MNDDGILQISMFIGTNNIPHHVLTLFLQS